MLYKNDVSLVTVKGKHSDKYGAFATCSSEDFERVSKYKWTWRSDGYITGKVNGSNVMISRFIMLDGTKSDMYVDHINGNKKNNTRRNLRLVTPSQNAQNRKKQEGTTSKFYGISVVKKTGKFCAAISVNSKTINIGKFESEIKAAEEHDIYVVHHNMFQKLNFPEKIDYYNLCDKREKRTLKRLRYNNVYKNQSNSFLAKITHKKRLKYIGTFKTEIEAAKTIDKYITSNGLGQKLNFPEDYPEYVFEKPIKTLYKLTENPEIIQLILNSTDKSVLIDLSDYDLIKYGTCHLSSNNYAIISINGQSHRLNRFIMNEKDQNVMIDHLNGDKLNNTKNNLRKTDATGNARNRKKSKSNPTTSKYIGVHLAKKGYKKWTATVFGKYIGVYNTEKVAAKRRDLYILMNYPNDIFNLNFNWSHNEVLFWTK